MLIPVLFMLFSCQQKVGQEFVVADFQEDLEFLLNTLREVHPDLYALQSECNFESKIARLEELIRSNPTLTEFNAGIVKLVASISDDHTHADLSVDALMNLIKNNNLLVLPYYLKVQDTAIFVIEDYSYENQLPAGTRVLTINGIAAQRIIDTLISYISCERDYPKPALLSDQFSLFYHYVFGFSDQYSIEYLKHDKSTESIRSKGLNFEQIREISQVSGESSNEIELYQQIDPSFLVMKVPTFYYPNKQLYSDRLNSLFKEIRLTGCENLIIDISKNGGGSSENVELLLEYLTDKPFMLFDSCLVKITEANRAEYLYSYRSQMQQVEGALYAEKMTMRIPEERENRFEGKLYLLIGPKTFSSSSAMASAFKCYDLGVLIGEETGGLTATYGDICSFQLPHSGIQFHVSTKYFVQACGKQDFHGVVPDVMVRRSIYDEIETDNYYAEVIDRLIKNQKKAALSGSFSSIADN